jgi:hypothetical protein
MSHWLTDLQSLQYSSRSVPMSGRYTVTSTGWHCCPCDWRVWRHLNSVTSVTRWQTSLESLQGDGTRRLTGLGLFQQDDTSFRGTECTTVTSKMTPVSLWLTGPKSILLGDTCVPVTSRSRVTSNRLTAVSLWVTCLESLQDGQTSVLATIRFAVTSTGWHQCPGDWLF